MSNKGVWKVVKRSEVPDNHHLIGNKWVFKTKKDGVHQARLVALGYSQIPGVNYTDNFAPVINDVTFQIVLTMVLVKGWEAKVINAEMTFLYKDIKEMMMIQELREEVSGAGGFMIAAHPFRGFKTFGIGQLQMTVEHACKRKVLEYVDAIEVGNGKLSPDENEMARKVSEKLGIPGTGGSDAHRVDEVGKWLTVFEKEIKDERELVQELHAGRFTANQRPPAELWE